MEHTTKERDSNLSVSLQITYPAHKRLATPLGSTSPTLFKQWCGLFYFPQRTKVLWDGNYGFSSLSEKTRKSNCLQKSLQRQHFLLSYFKDPECWSSGVWNSQPPTQQTDTLSTELTRQRSNDNKLQDKLTAQDPQVFAIPILSSQF